MGLTSLLHSALSYLPVAQAKEKRAVRSVLLGPPGAGKGTQAPQLAEAHNVCHLSTGDMLRAISKQDSPLAKKVAKTLEAGELVTDSLVIEIIEANLQSEECKCGFMLDGFPRNLVQAKKLDEYLESLDEPLNNVIEFKVDDEILVGRISGRLIHQASGRTYHTEFAPPKVAEKDDVTGEALYRRPDDNPVILAKRLGIYHEHTAPLIEFYSSKGILCSIDAMQKPDQVFKDITKQFEKCASM